MTLTLKKFIKEPSYWPIVLHIAISIYLICTLNIWTDESYTLTTTSQGIGHAFYQAIHFENQPPLYFVLLNLWRQINSSIIWARLFSLGCTALTIAIAPALCKRYTPQVNPAFLTSILAINPFLIWCAVDIRAYGFGIFLSTLLNLFFYDAFLAEKENKKALFLYVLIAILSLYTHYFLVCLLIAHALLIAGTLQVRIISRYAIAAFSYSLGFTPALSFFILHLQDQGTGLATASIPFKETLHTVIALLFYYSVPLYGEWGRRSLLQSLQYSFIICTVITYIWLIFRKKIQNFDLIFKLLLISFIVFTAIVYLTGTTPMAFRYGFPLLTISQISIVFMIDRVSSIFSLKKIIIVGSIAIISLFCIYSNHSMNQSLAREGDWIRVTNYIQKNEQKNQPILLYSGSQIHAFSAYYDGINSVVPIPPQTAKLDKFDMSRVKISSQRELETYLTEPTKASELVWMIKAPGYIVNRNAQGQCIFGDININCEMIDQFIGQRFQVKQRMKFYESEVLLLQKK